MAHRREVARSRLAAGSAVVGVAILALAACSGSSSNSGGAAASGNAAPAAAAAVTPAAATPAAAVPDACTVITPQQVQQALGVLGPEHVSGPEMLGPGRCAWHSSDPTCLMRSLGIEIMGGAQAQQGFNDTKAAATLRDDVPGLGQAAFASTDLMPFGTGAQVERLNVEDGGFWLRFTTAGRVGDSGRGILTTVATQVLANPNLVA